MSNWDTESLVADDKKYVWHPFTPMGTWCAPEHEPLVLVSGEGAIVRDRRGREYIDGNSSIWTNIHGHNHPRINAAIRAQLDRVAHTSFLDTANPPAIELAREIVKLFPRREVRAVIIEPIGQGAAGMKIWQIGTPQKVRSWCDSAGALLIADEVMTGFGRTEKMFAWEHETSFHIYVFAKGLTGGYLALALTLVSHEVFDPHTAHSYHCCFHASVMYNSFAIGKDTDSFK